MTYQQDPDRPGRIPPSPRPTEGYGLMLPIALGVALILLLGYFVFGSRTASQNPAPEASRTEAPATKTPASPNAPATTPQPQGPAGSNK
jgi:hypothetical protein